MANMLPRGDDSRREETWKQKKLFAKYVRGIANVFVL